MFDDIGPMQLGIVLVIVVMVFGAGKLPQAAGSLGKAIKEFKKETARTDDDEIDGVKSREKGAKAQQTPGAVKTASEITTNGENEEKSLDEKPLVETSEVAPKKKQARVKRIPGAKKTAGEKSLVVEANEVAVTIALAKKEND